MMWIGASQSSAAGLPSTLHDVDRSFPIIGGRPAGEWRGGQRRGGSTIRSGHSSARGSSAPAAGAHAHRSSIWGENLNGAPYGWNPLSLPRTRTRCGRIDPLISTLVGIVNWGRPVRYSALYRPLGTSNGHTPRHPPWCNFSFKKCLEYNATVLVHLVVQGVRSGTRASARVCAAASKILKILTLSRLRINDTTARFSSIVLRR